MIVSGSIQTQIQEETFVGDFLLCSFSLFGENFWKLLSPSLCRFLSCADVSFRTTTSISSPAQDESPSWRRAEAKGITEE